MRLVARLGLVVSLALLGACTEDGDLLVEDDEPGADAAADGGGDGGGDAAEGRTLSELCADATTLIEDVGDGMGDMGSLEDVQQVRDALEEQRDELESLAAELDDMSVQGADEEAVVDALDQAVASAQAAADAAADGDLQGARDELEQMLDQVGDARDEAANADVDCSS